MNQGSHYTVDDALKLSIAPYYIGCSTLLFPFPQKHV